MIMVSYGINTTATNSLATLVCKPCIEAAPNRKDPV